VLTVHGGDVFGLRGGTLDRFSRYALRHADRVTVNSSATETAVREIAGDQATVSLVPIGADLDRTARAELVEAVRARHRSATGPLLTFVGRVVEEKGVEDIVAAVSILAERMPGVSAIIAGTGQHVDRVHALAGELGVTDRVHLPGWLDPADVPSWLAAADIVLAPSRIGADGWVEAQGLAVIEAMAIGRPVVATHTGGIPDTIRDGVTGLLVPPADPIALAEAVQRLVASPRVASEIAARGAEFVRGRFDRSVTAERFDSLYREVLAARSDGARRHGPVWQSPRP
jgi:glycosyltransferase involved in cell wall biosynthesis